MLIIAVDFDGTIVDHRYPDIGAEIPGACEWLNRLRSSGCLLILWTIRSGSTLEQAVDWCKQRGVEFFGVNKNPEQTWSESPKAYAHVYVDDAAIGCPLRELPRMGARPGVDWHKVGPMLLAECLKREQQLKGTD